MRPRGNSHLQRPFCCTGSGTRRPFGDCLHWGLARPCCAAATPARFPDTYEAAVADAQSATRAALADGVRLLEVEVPTAGLQSVAGDAEGQNEMTYSLEFLRKFLVMFQLEGTAATTRVYFPDKQEMRVAQSGAKGRRNGVKAVEAQFAAGTAFRLDYLTEPTGLLDLGFDARRVDVAGRAAADDSAYIAAYPHFNVNEMIALAEAWETRLASSGAPLIVFNGELDRLRSSYYPAFLYPKLARVGKEFVPKFEAAYYIHNFKGSKPATLFRAYPGPWRVVREVPGGAVEVVHEQEARPPLREVALEIVQRL